MAFDWLKRNTVPNAGLGRGADGASRGGTRVERVDGGETDEALDGEKIVKRRHVDWLEHQIRWRWLMDSLEGGDRYRNADLRPRPPRPALPQSLPPQTRVPRPAAISQLLLRAFGGFVGAIADVQVIDAYGCGPYPGLARRRPRRDGDGRRLRAAPVANAGARVRRRGDGNPPGQRSTTRRSAAKDPTTSRRGGRTSTAAARRSTTTCARRSRRSCSSWARIDVCLDHPKAPPGQVVKTRADELRLGLDKVVASYILPMNMVWWRTDNAGRYLECLVREYVDPADRMDYDKNGNAIDPDDPGDVGETWRRTTSAGGSGGRTSRSSSTSTARDPRSNPAQFRPRADRAADRPEKAPYADGRQVAVRGDRGVSARILQSRLRADPFRHTAGTSVPLRTGGLLQGRQHALGWARLLPAEEEEHREREHTRGSSTSRRRRTRPSRCGRTRKTWST